MTLTAAQCRAARALLNWSREQLSVAAGVAIRTISDFESERREPIRATLAAIRAALEFGGVEFIPRNGSGPGVRLRSGGNE